VAYRVCVKLGERALARVRSLERLHIYRPLTHSHPSSHDPHRSLSSLMPPAPRRRSLIWVGSALLQTAIIERLGQSNLRQNRKDEDFQQSMM
jgi:hypothetical protein